jgi:predicted MFS family arabinose efflux permease
MGFGIATTFYATIAADNIPNSRRGENLGYWGLGTTVAMAVAPALGIWLLSDYGFSAVFIVAVLCQVIAFGWTHLCTIHSSIPVDLHREEGSSLVFFEKGTWFPSLLTILFGISYTLSQYFNFNNPTL